MRMNLLPICMAIVIACSQVNADLAKYIESSSKCGEDLQGVYNDLCKELGGKKDGGPKLVPLEKKCVDTPASLKKFPEVVNALQNCKKPDMFCDQEKMKSCGEKWITDAETEYKKRVKDDKKSLKELVMTESVMKEIHENCEKAKKCLKGELEQIKKKG